MSAPPAECGQGSTGGDDARGASDLEALRMLQSLLRTYIGKRSIGDILSIMVDPSVPLRLYPVHRTRYDEMLDTFAEVQVEDASGGAGEAGTAGALATAGGAREGAGGAADVAAKGFLPCAALAAIFARAAYGALMRRGQGDSVHAFLQGATKSAYGSWDADAHLCAFLELAGAHPEDVLLSSWSEQTFQPAFVVFWVHQLHWLVLTIRGSSELGSILTDVAAEECEVAGGLAHSGITRAARWVLRRAGPTIAGALRGIPEYRLVCAGHSLGGDIAALIAVIFREGDSGLGVSPGGSPASRSEGEGGGGPRAAGAEAAPQEECGGGFAAAVGAEAASPCGGSTGAAAVSGEEVLGQRTLAYAFGASPIMSPELADRCRPYVLSVSRDADYITRVSAFGLDRLILQLTEHSAAQVARRWLSDRLGLGKGSSGSTSRTRTFGPGARVPEVMATPGALLHVDRCGLGGRRQAPARLYWAEPWFYHEVFVSAHMFHDHLPIRYIEDLLDIIRRAVPGRARDLHLQGRAGADPDAQRAVRRGLEGIIAERSVRELSGRGGGCTRSSS